MQGKPEQSLILDSTPWIPDHVCNLSEIPDSFSCIPDSKPRVRISPAKISRIPESGFPYMGRDK